ncbi:hypothetical protein ACFXKY_12605 [Streptomyces canus]
MTSAVDDQHVRTEKAVVATVLVQPPGVASMNTMSMPRGGVAH